MILRIIAIKQILITEVKIFRSSQREFQLKMTFIKFEIEYQIYIKIYNQVSEYQINTKAFN